MTEAATRADLWCDAAAAWMPPFTATFVPGARCKLGAVSRRDTLVYANAVAKNPVVSRAGGRKPIVYG
jgi:hypothetical protein